MSAGIETAPLPRPTTTEQPGPQPATSGCGTSPASRSLASASCLYSTLEVRTILADANFENLARGEMRWEGDHLRVVLTVNDSKAIDKSIVSELSAKLRKIGCRCILDDGCKELVRCSLPIACSNRFRSLKDDDVTIKKRDCVGVPQGGLQSRSAYHREYGLQVGSWNLSGLCSQRKLKEVSEVLNKLKLDIVAAQESWEREGSVIDRSAGL